MVFCKNKDSFRPLKQRKYFFYQYKKNYLEIFIYNKNKCRWEKTSWTREIYLIHYFNAIISYFRAYGTESPPINILEWHFLFTYLCNTWKKYNKFTNFFVGITKYVEECFLLSNFSIIYLKIHFIYVVCFL